MFVSLYLLRWIFCALFRAQKEADYEKKQHGKKQSFAEKIVEIIRTSPSINEMREQLQDYHDNDIAQVCNS